MKEKLGLEELVLPFALHGDGVPVQGTIRQEGLDFLTVNLPGAHALHFATRLLPLGIRN